MFAEEEEAAAAGAYYKPAVGLEEGNSQWIAYIFIAIKLMC
jgi:hypothetical protein